jgi:thioredoxin-related protein
LSFFLFFLLFRFAKKEREKKVVLKRESRSFIRKNEFFILLFKKMNTDFLKHFEKKIKDIKQMQEQELFILTSFEKS